MSKTYKDRPYYLAEREALAVGYDNGWWTRWVTVKPEWRADVDGYAYTRHNHRTHLRLRRRSDWRWIEGDWSTDYGNERRIGQLLKMACREANSGLMSEDWDDPLVYQRRRRWYM
ncbi:hypothetical protein [Bifidobacterium simiarum]|uniref:Uncharacterized protein n=1 Tax=Bifidobacterium simiarum TaxID=2045441 RepID=A0A2M9HDA6_9BIFI|nr:hypothetical protein [Bifidobacterium simiarum]PJM74798.1 hypothetical protein CSQ87_08735 [Bifidobacterium simiarum]